MDTCEKALHCDYYRIIWLDKAIFDSIENENLDDDFFKITNNIIQIKIIFLIKYISHANY